MSDFGTSSQGSGAMFFHIMIGKDDKQQPKAFVVTRVPEGTPGAILEIKKDGSLKLDNNTQKQIWVLAYDYLEGRLADVYDKLITYEKEGATKETTYTKVVIYGKSVKMELSLNEYDRNWVDLMKRLPNVDLSKPVRLTPFYIVDKTTGNPNQGISISQDGKKVEMVWNAANNWGNDENGRGGLPSGVQVEDPVKGNMVWSFLKRDRWLKAQVQTPIKQQLEAMVQNNEVPLPGSERKVVEEPQHTEKVDDGPKGYTGAGSPDLGDEDDDLPF